MGKSKKPVTRRKVLATGGAALAGAGLAGSVPRFASEWLESAGQTEARTPARNVRGTRALVGIYLFGGSDSNNLIVPMDDPQYGAYRRARRSLALAKRDLLPIAASDNRRFGLHPAVEELHQIYQAGSLAIVANVGDTRRVDQVRQSRQRHADADLHYLPNGYAVPEWAARWAGIDGTGDSQRVLTGFATTVSGREINNTTLLHDADWVSSTDIRMRGDAILQRSPTAFPSSGLGQQLRHVAALVSAGSEIGIDRMVFFCPVGGFDTHAGQSKKEARLFRELSQALGAFNRAALDLAIADRVVTFTDTEFGRTLVPNKNGGTDHGWGSHQLVMGGGIRGGDVYGRFPEMTPGSRDDLASAGVWIPTTSKEDMNTTLTAWLNASPATALPLFV